MWQPTKGMRMRRWVRAAVAVAVVALAVASVASAANLSGRFTARVGNAPVPALDGTWTLTIGGGTYSVSFRGIAERGRLSLHGSTVDVGPTTGQLACKGGAASGSYRYSLAGSTLRLQRIHDSCPTRAFLLSHTFTKA
jgi:hypothetical protein